MHTLSKIIFDNYQVRKTNAQKTAFIDLLKQYYPDLVVEEGGVPRNRNIVIGDVEHANIIVTAHYDTCAQLPFPNLIAPKNILFTLLYGLLIALPFMFLIILIELALLFCSVDLEIASILAPLISVGSLVWLALFGIPNKHTANDNTSGVIALCELLEMLTPQQLQTTAFVFFDNEEYGLFGSSYFKKLHKKRLKEFLLINLDCISDGDHLLLVTSKDARKKYMELLEASFQDSGDKTYHFEKAETTMYPSDQINFPIHVAIAALNKKPFIGLYMDKIHTKRDCVFDEKNIQCICSGIQTLIEKAAGVE